MWCSAGLEEPLDFITAFSSMQSLTELFWTVKISQGLCNNITAREVSRFRLLKLVSAVRY